MAIVKIPKQELAKHLKVNDELLQKINLLGIPLEQVTEQEIEVEVMPNRSDALSVQGFLRALLPFVGKEKPRIYRVKNPEKDFIVEIDESVKNVRPCTACAIVKNIAFNDEKIKEIIDLQEKLHITLGRNRKKAAIGVYPLEKIQLPIRFEARKPSEIRFIPLESSEEMNGLQILQRHPTGRAYAHLLSGVDKFPVFVDAKNNILSMPPIINSHETGKITEATKEVFVECSGFDFLSLKKILNIMVTTLADMGGTVYAMEIKQHKKETTLTPNLSPEKMKLSLENVNKLLGLKLKESDLEKLLLKMGHEYKRGIARVPAWRADILHEVDIIEDIAIAYGYDLLIPEIPKVATIGEESESGKFYQKLSDFLIGTGLVEVSTFHFIKENELARSKSAQKIELENSKTEYKFLRPSLLLPALRIFAENKDHEYPQKIFEIGTVFSRDSRAETGIAEASHLIVACSPANFTELKQMLDYLFKSFHLTYTLKESSHEGCIEGRTGSIVVEGKSAGVIAELHPETLQDWNIKMPIAFFEIDLEPFLRKHEDA